MQQPDTPTDRHVLRMLAQQIAVAQLDGLRDIERAAQRAMRALKRGDTSRLDAEAAEALEYARGSMVRVLSNGALVVDADDDTEAAE